MKSGNGREGGLESEAGGGQRQRARDGEGEERRERNGGEGERGGEERFIVPMPLHQQKLQHI